MTHEATERTHAPKQSRSAMFAAALAATMGRFPSVPTGKPRKPVPMMVTASPEEIRAWNEAVETKNPRPTIKQKQFRRQMVALFGRRVGLRIIKKKRAKAKSVEAAKEVA